MTLASSGQAAIIRTERGLTISGTAADGTEAIGGSSRLLAAAELNRC